jgi:hypothetical protein
MKPTLVPALVGRDAVSQWQALWDPARANDAERAVALSTGDPVGYWMPAVGLAGMWTWPDGGRTTVEALPSLVTVEPGGGAKRSEDAGLTWHLEQPPSPGSPQAPAPKAKGSWLVAAAIAGLALFMLWGSTRAPRRRR